MPLSFSLDFEARKIRAWNKYGERVSRNQEIRFILCNMHESLAGPGLDRLRMARASFRG